MRVSGAAGSKEQCWVSLAEHERIGSVRRSLLWCWGRNCTVYGFENISLQPRAKLAEKQHCPRLVLSTDHPGQLTMLFKPEARSPRGLRPMFSSAPRTSVEM